MSRSCLMHVSLSAIVSVSLTAASFGQQRSSNQPVRPQENHPLRLAYAPQEKSPKPPAEHTVSDRTTVRTETKTVEEFGYKEISSFFNIREANANVDQGEWELEFEGEWSTSSDGSDDDVEAAVSLKYGITDDVWVEIEVLPINLGDGGNQGAGDLGLSLFKQWTKEGEHWAAFATWADMRIPTGDGSEGVDGALHFTITKTLAPRWRMHWDGYIMTANGEIGDDDSDRRHFQWGLGPGFDYEFSEATIGTINYLHRSSEEYGHSNVHVLERGVAHELCEGQHLKAAVDIGLDGRKDNDNFGAKLQWSIEF